MQLNDFILITIVVLIVAGHAEGWRQPLTAATKLQQQTRGGSSSKRRMLLQRTNARSERYRASPLNVAADYAAEIESVAVGPEIYGPIFRAGLWIFLSGIVSTFVVAVLITKDNLWGSLLENIQEGEELQAKEYSEKVQKENTDVPELQNLDL